VSGTPLVNGMLERCRGVLADHDQQAEDPFAAALRHHDHRVPPYERAVQFPNELRKALSPRHCEVVKPTPFTRHGPGPAGRASRLPGDPDASPCCATSP